MISVFHHLGQVPSRFCQIPISPSRVGQTVNGRNPSQQNPVSAHLEQTPCIDNSFKETYPSYIMASDDLTICHVDTLWYIQRIFESGKTYKLVAFLHDLFPTDLKGNFQATPSIENFLCPLCCYAVYAPQGKKHDSLTMQARPIFSTSPHNSPLHSIRLRVDIWVTS